MALVVKDRVKQTTTTTGTGSIVLNGNVSGFQTFTAALSNGDTTYYGIFEPSTNEYEVGLGTWTESTATLARTTVLESSNSGSAVNLTAQAEVFITQPAEKAVFQDSNGDVDLGGNKILFGNLYSTTGDLPSASTYHGMFAHVHGTGKAYYAHGGNWIELVNEDTSGNVSMGGNLTVTGDLTVNGTTTTVNTTNTVVTDSLIELANGTTGSPSNDAGIVIERGDSNNAFIGYDESADKFTVGTGSFTGASTGNLTITTGTLVANVEGNVTGNVTGNVSGSSGSTTGNAATATALATARNIGGVSFDGTANINLPGVNTAGNQDTSGNAATATTAGTVTTAAQPNITSVGTLTSATISGDLTVDTSTLKVDSSNNRVGIGTTSPTADLSIVDSSTSSGIEIQPEVTTDTNRITNYDRGDNSYKKFRLDASEQQLYISGSEKARLDSSGNLHVGRTTADSSVAGFTAQSSGVMYNAFAGRPYYVNRLSSDGEIIELAKDGTSIGSIGVESSDQVYFSRATGSQGIKLKNGAAMPCNADGTDSDDDQDLGSSSVRWKDGYFSRDLIVGDQILHDGDGDTYLQFHNANEFRIVTGGTEMLEVNDSTVQLGATLDANGNNLDNVEDIYLRDKLFHDGDTGNNIEFETGYIKFNHDSSVRFYFDQYGLWNEGTYWDDYEALSGTSPTIDVDTGGAFSLTMSGNTTFTFANPQFNNYGGGFVLQLTGNGGTVTWPNSVDWAGGTAPDAPANGETDILVFWTRDQGTTWYGVLSVDAAA